MKKLEMGQTDSNISEVCPQIRKMGQTPQKNR